MNLFSRRFSFFLLFVTLFFSCTKIITTDIGADLIPPVDGVITKDTILEVISKNTDYDTISVGLSDNHVLGYTDDPVFGKTTASVNFQVTPPAFPFSWGIPKDDITLDSVVLCLSYKGVWGDASKNLNLRVYTIDPEVIFKKSAYKNTAAFLKGKEITESNTPHTVVISKLGNVDTTDGYYTEVTTNQIRIRLNNSFGQQLIDYDSATVYKNDASFYNYLRGLIVEPDETGQALLRVNLTDTATRLSVYYHKTSADTVKASRRFSPDVETSASSNSIIRKYEGTQIPSYISSPDTNDDLIFMQASPGTYATLKIPGVDTMRNVIVHRAEILMYQVPDNDTGIFTPPNLFLSAYSNITNRSFAIPYDITFFGSTISNLTQFGVAPKTYTDPTNQKKSIYYSFDISRYVQGIITRGDPLYDLVLTAPYNQSIYPDNTALFTVPISSPTLNTVATGRIRLGGGSNGQHKMKLHIVYSLIQ